MKKQNPEERQRILLDKCRIITKINESGEMSLSEREQVRQARDDILKQPAEQKDRWKSILDIFLLVSQGFDLPREKLKKAYIDFCCIEYKSDWDLKKAVPDEKQLEERLKKSLCSMDKAYRLNEFSICHAMTARQRNRLYQHNERLVWQMEAVREYLKGGS